MTDTAIAPAAPGAAASDLLSRGNSASPPAAPSWQPAGIPVTPGAFDAPEAVAARAEIKTKIGDSAFYKELKAERERSVSGPASQAWADLHAKGYPSAPGVSSQADVNAHATARTEEQWNTFFSGL